MSPEELPWNKMDTAPTDGQELFLRAWIIPSHVASMNGSQEFMAYGIGRPYSQDKTLWTGILGQKPDEWCELKYAPENFR